MRFVEAFKVILLAALVGGIVAVSGFLVLDRIQPGDITIGPGEPGSILVFIEGAVEQPGEYELLAGSRLSELITAAEGFTSDANTTGLNMAGRLADGDHVVVPRVSQQTSTGEDTAGTPLPPVAGLININTASVGELVQLPGIGPVLAQRIIDFREFNGPFTTIDQLAEVAGISEATVDGLRDLVTVGG